jgi:hypothetical protein
MCVRPFHAPDSTTNKSIRNPDIGPTLSNLHQTVNVANPAEAADRPRERTESDVGREETKALNLMTVQLEADPPQAETCLPRPAQAG